MKILEEKRDFEFMTERVKERPLNKRKLLRKTIITVTMAVIFGLIACVTFLVLEPVFSNWLYPGEEIEMIEIPQDTDEVLPEDMLVHEESMLEQTEQVINSLKNEMQLNPSSYQELYSSIYVLTQELNAAMVTVTSVSQDIDWFNDPYENKGQTTGFLFADNNRELTVGEELKVTFANGDQATAAIKGTDTETGLTVLAVEKDALVETTTESIQFINLGRSAGARLTASPVVAIGRPLGKQNSVVFGMITSEDTVLSLTDANYKLLTTDIYGSTDATGLLINMDGQVIGVINQSYNNKTAANLISAIGITELKLVLQRMSNGFENSYLGIKGTDVPEEIAVSLKVPQGAYVTGIVMDSPAMAAGIQSGDVIVQMGKLEIRSFKDYTEAVRQKNPGEVVEMVVMRQGQQTYRMVNLEVTMGKLEY